MSTYSSWFEAPGLGAGWSLTPQNWSFRLYYRGRAGKRDSKLGTGATRKPSVPVVLVTNECFVPIHMLWWGDERIVHIRWSTVFVTGAKILGGCCSNTRKNIVKQITKLLQGEDQFLIFRRKILVGWVMLNVVMKTCVCVCCSCTKPRMI